MTIHYKAIDITVNDEFLLTLLCNGGASTLKDLVGTVEKSVGSLVNLCRSVPITFGPNNEGHINGTE